VRTHCLHLQVGLITRTNSRYISPLSVLLSENIRDLLLYPDDGGRMFLRNVRRTAQSPDAD
jgi:hypothetical protein